MFDDKAPLFSLHERQLLATQTEREALAQMVRILARLKIALLVSHAQEKVRLAEEGALRPQRQTGPSVQGFWQRIFSGPERHTPEPASLTEGEVGRNEVEVAQGALERLVAIDGPILIQHAEAVALALESTSTAPPERTTDEPQRPPTDGRRSARVATTTARPRQRAEKEALPATKTEEQP